MITPIKFLSEVKPGETFSEDTEHWYVRVSHYDEVGIEDWKNIWAYDKENHSVFFVCTADEAKTTKVIFIKEF